jgi:Na+/pantothenate symporter
MKPTCNAVTIKDSAIQKYQKDFLKILEDYIIQIFFLFLLAKKYILNQKLQMRSSIKTLNLNYCFFKFILKEIRKY